MKSFRKVERRDLEILQKLKYDTIDTTHSTTLNNWDNQEAWFEKISKDSSKLFLIWWDENEKENIGTFKIDSIDSVYRSANIGYDLFKPYRGKGLGKELVAKGVKFCFNTLNLRRLQCEILATNLASIKCAEAAGFKQEGIKQQAIYKNGVYLNSIMYAALKDVAI